MNDNIADLADKMFQKKVNQNLTDFVSKLERLKDNPCLVQGLVPVIQAILSGISAFRFRDNNAWEAALYMRYDVGPDGRAESLTMDFVSDVALQGGEDNPPFMTVTASVGDKWIELISKPLATLDPTAPDDVVPKMDRFADVEGEDLINNFAFIEYAMAADLRDQGFTQYVLTDPSTMEIGLVSIKGPVGVVFAINNKVHLDDHLFLKNYGK